MTHGKNLAALVRRAPEIGIAVNPVRRTGELRFSHPAMNNTVRVNGRRKDSPRALTTFFIHVETKNANAASQLLAQA